MESYLDNKTQVVSVNNKTSETGNITCGVPQGSILGPFLPFTSLHGWGKENGMLLNTEKMKAVIITTRKKNLHIDESILSLSYIV